MLTDEDVKKLSGILPTKDDFNRLTLTVADLKVSSDEMKTGIAELKTSISSLTTAVDGLVKAISDLRAEYAAVANKSARHEKWILQLAEKVGLKLEE